MGGINYLYNILPLIIGDYLVWIVRWCAQLCFLPLLFCSCLSFPLHCCVPPSVLFPGRWAQLFNCSQTSSSILLSPKSPQSPLTDTLRSPSSSSASSQQSFSSLLHGSRLHHVFFRVETSAHLNQMGALQVSCEKSYCSTSFIFSLLDVFPVTALRSERHQWPKFGKAC